MASKEQDKRARKTARKEAAERRRAAEAARSDAEPTSDRDSDAPEAADEAESNDAALALRSGGELAGIGEGDGAGAMAADGESDAPLAEGDDEGDTAAAQLGTERYVLAGFFGAGILGAYVLGRLIHGVWSTVSNKDWFARAVPWLAAVSDEDKGTYGTIVGAVIALIAVIRVYRKPDVRTWSDEVASELAKVKWPTRKEVTNSTMVVIAASTVATLYLMLLDRLWSFITNLVYGSGS